MHIINRWTMGMGLVLLIAVSLCSCSSSRRLGCPTKITRTDAPNPAPLQARVVFPIA